MSYHYLAVVWKRPLNTPIRRVPPVALFSPGDMSEKTSAAKGGITKVTHTDYEITVVLVFFRRVILITYGE